MPQSNDQSWISVSQPIMHAEFTTHLNYLKCIKHFSENLSISAVTLGQVSRCSSLIHKKKILVDLTKSNLDAEMGQINSVIDYSQVCISWVPVKSYYLFFNLLLILLYLITGEERWLTEDHGNVHRKFKDLVRDEEISFSIPSFNTLYIPSRIISWHIPAGNNVVTNRQDYSLLEKQLIKKMLAYSKEDFKRQRKIKSLRDSNNRKFLNSTTVNLCEFFYWYRLKANYRDMEFVHSAVGTSDFYEFYSEYFGLTNNFYEALVAEINRLSNVRFSQAIF